MSVSERILRGVEVNEQLAAAGRPRLPTELVNVLLREVHPDDAFEAFDLWLAIGRWTSPAGEEFVEAE